MTVLFTGSSGFIGNNFRESYQCSNYIYIDRSDANITQHTDWSNLLLGVDTIVHLAAIAHKPILDQRDILNINYLAVINLAKQAAAKGIKKFIFISSINVHEVNETDMTNVYTQAKLLAEKELLALFSSSLMSIIIIRSPLVYGPNVKGNFKTLLKLSSRKLPLPFGLIDSNRRSFVSVYNLMDLIVTCINYHKPIHNIIYVSDGAPISTKTLITNIKQAFKVKPVFIPVPVFMFVLLGKILNKNELIENLVGTLIAEGGTHLNEFKWVPPFSMTDGMALTVNNYIEKRDV